MADRQSYMLEIPTRAVSKGSTRPRIVNGKVFTVQVNRKPLNDLKKIVHTYCALKRVKIYSGPVFLRINYVFKRPLYHFVGRNRQKLLKQDAPVWHTKTPDLDKLDRGILDCLTGVAYLDDKQVYKLDSTKLYGKEDSITIWIFPK